MCTWETAKGSGENRKSPVVSEEGGKNLERPGDTRNKETGLGSTLKSLSGFVAVSKSPDRLGERRNIPERVADESTSRITKLMGREHS